MAEKSLKATRKLYPEQVKLLYQNSTNQSLSNNGNWYILSRASTLYNAHKTRAGKLLQKQRITARSLSRKSQLETDIWDVSRLKHT